MRLVVGLLVSFMSALALVGCESGSDEVGFEHPMDFESLEPLSGDELRYLAFQVFEGGPDPAIPFDGELVYTPKQKVADMVHNIVTTIGVTGGQKTRLAFILGPIAFDHSDAEVQQIIDDGFDIALSENVAVGFHVDDAMFWSRRGDLITDPTNIEWTDFDATPATGLHLEWARPPARMVFNSPTIRTEVTRRARDVIGARIASHVAILRSLGKEDLFAGVIAGWESHMGQDVSTMDRVGFHALANAGFGPQNPPSNIGAELASIVAEFIGLWTDGLAQGGIDANRVYTHVAFLPRARFEEISAPEGVTYEDVLDAAPSSQRPSVAFTANARPGFSTYPVTGVYEQIYEQLSEHGNPWWASSEGTNIIPGDDPESSGISMETYLARSFNHGAALVTIFGWGIGDQSNPFRTVTEGSDALATYRRFLSQ
ncbi:MAG TPA: hypothetical protein DCZ03_13790 [Gammaproteobacteria bacterium]|nr:hypothetical protein [Gammaproteobacteria bacterium]